MSTHTKAPDIPNPQYPNGGYPTKPGTRLAKAWSQIWRKLENASDALDGRVLADEIGPKNDLAPTTLVALLSRAASAGVLEREHRDVVSGRGNRRRTHYRIPAK